MLKKENTLQMFKDEEAFAVALALTSRLGSCISTRELKVTAQFGSLLSFYLPRYHAVGT